MASKVAVNWRWHSPDLGGNAGLCQPRTLPWNLCSRQDAPQVSCVNVCCRAKLQSAWRGSRRLFGALCRVRGWPRYPWYIYINKVCWEERQNICPVLVTENHYDFLWKLSTVILILHCLQDFALVVFCRFVRSVGLNWNSTRTQLRLCSCFYQWRRRRSEPFNDPKKATSKEFYDLVVILYQVRPLTLKTLSRQESYFWDVFDPETLNHLWRHHFWRHQIVLISS